MQIEDIEVCYGAAGLAVVSPVNCCPQRDCVRKYGATHSVIIMIIFEFKILRKCLPLYILPWEKEQTEILLAPFSNMLTSTQSRKRQSRAVMLEWEPNFGKHQSGSGEGTSCSLEAKGGMMPTLLHAQHQSSSDSWGDGLQRRENIRCSPCSAFPKF